MSVYEYNYANKVWSDIRGAGPCFATHYNCKWFELPRIMSEDDCNIYLSEIAKEIPFEWEFTLHKKSEYENRVKIFTPDGTQKFMILFGNLCKGVSEFAWFVEEQVKDKSADPFLVKNFNAFKKCMPDIYLKKQVNHFGHLWWDREMMTESAVYIRKTKTLIKLFKRLPKASPPYIWKVCLD